MSPDEGICGNMHGIGVTENPVNLQSAGLHRSAAAPGRSPRENQVPSPLFGQAGSPRNAVPHGE